MPTGVSPLLYPDQPKPASDLELDNSYFLLRLHNAQAFFKAGWLVRPGFLFISTSVESTFQPESPMQSLHQLTRLLRNTPCYLGINTNLTDWLPARASDTLRITLKYSVVQDSPFRELVDQLGQMGLAAKVSLVRPDWAVGIKVSEIVGRLLSCVLREGSQHEVFLLAADLNLANLKTGFYAVVGSYGDEDWPMVLRVGDAGRLTDEHGHLLLRHSYAVLEVLAIPRRGDETARNEPWWELLQTGKEQAMDACADSSQDRQRVLEDWRSTLVKVRALARKDYSFLLQEVKDIIHVAQREVEEKLPRQTNAESSWFDTYAEDWQETLGVRTRLGLQQSVQVYLGALDRSRRLKKDFRCFNS